MIETKYIQPVPHELASHLKFWQLDPDAYAADVWMGGLSVDDYARADRMAFARDARRYLACKHAPRHVLAVALDYSVESVAIEIDEVDKPRLAGGGTLHINVSHSANLGVIALSRQKWLRKSERRNKWKLRAPSRAQ